MQERYLGRIEPGMDVCDVNGDKVGSVARVYRHEMAAVGAGVGSSSTGLGSEAHDEILEVKTGFLGLGSHLYVPIGEVQDMTSECVFLRVAKDVAEGWTEAPSDLETAS